MHPIAQLFTGYSFGALLVLALTHFNVHQYPEQRSVRWVGWALLAALALLQTAHAAWLWASWRWMDTPGYGALLLLVAPLFYLLARQVFEPQIEAPGAKVVAAHLAPAAAAFTAPLDWTLPLAFGLGSLYLVWLLRALWRLRSTRAQWGAELALLALATLTGAVVCALGLLQAWLPGQDFFAWYASAIGLALLLVQVLLGLRPQLAQEVRETAQALSALSYASTTLGAVDVDAVLAQLDVLMQREQRYRDPALNLPTLAQELGLGAHQLSELINTRLGKGFSRYLREQRVQAARHMLLAERSASVLSVGLSVGFTSQSNFYDAFREIEGMTPGQYRKLASSTDKAK
ncbi:MAG: AraC family transcriptional regulator [Rhodoferax sp.]|nr:AraC family transcriptional regulator [Rhodoferax sp.]